MVATPPPLRQNVWKDGGFMEVSQSKSAQSKIGNKEMWARYISNCWFRTFANSRTLSQKLPNYHLPPWLLWHQLCTLRRPITQLSQVSYQVTMLWRHHRTFSPKYMGWQSDCEYMFVSMFVWQSQLSWVGSKAYLSKVCDGKIFSTELWSWGRVDGQYINTHEKIPGISTLIYLWKMWKRLRTDYFSFGATSVGIKGIGNNKRVQKSLVLRCPCCKSQPKKSSLIRFFSSQK